MSQTRSAFALVVAQCTKKVLIIQGRGLTKWDLPGCQVEDGQDEREELVRAIREGTGLEVTVIEQVGPLHRFEGDTSVAYHCDADGGQLIETEEVQAHRFVSYEEFKRGTFLNSQHSVDPDDGVGPCAGEHVAVPFEFMGSIGGRLTWIGRILCDAFSILEEPETGPNESDAEGIFASDDGLYLIEEGDGEQRKWRRLDPYSPTGYMEPVAAPAS